jgi:hypothetical protein
VEKQAVKHLAATSLIAVAVLSLGACKSHFGPTISIGSLRTVNAVPDSKSLDVTVADYSGVNTTGTAYGMDSGQFLVGGGQYSVQLSVTPAAGSGSKATLNVNGVEIDNGHQTTIYAVGALGNNSLKAVTVNEDLSSAVPAGQTRLQFVNASFTATSSASNGAGTIYLVAPGAPLANAVFTAPLDSAASGSSQFFSAPVTLPTGAYEVVIQSLVNGVNTTIYDSGQKTGISFASTDNFQIAVLDATAAQITSNTSPVQLAVMDYQNDSLSTYLDGSNGVPSSN